MYYFFKNIWIFIVGGINAVFKLRGKSGICMIGHRGYSSKYIDNTAPSFIAAAKHGSGGVETDVRITKDNKMILCHNGSADYADGTNLTIAENTFEDLLAKPLKNEYNSEKVYLCTFKEYLEICRENNLICFIELKGSFPDEKIVEAFKLAAEVYDLKKCCLQSFNIDNLIRAHELFPELSIMLTYGRGEFDKKVDYHRCIDLGFNIDADYSVTSKKMVRDFHSRGLEVGVWTCNDVFSLNYSRFLGVDYIESNMY